MSYETETKQVEVEASVSAVLHSVEQHGKDGWRVSAWVENGVNVIITYSRGVRAED